MVEINKLSNKYPTGPQAEILIKAKYIANM